MFSTKHTRDTNNPQTYIQHGWFATRYSVLLIIAGIIGLVHAVFPCWFKFYTAEQIIRIYIRIKNSGRHNDLLRRYEL